MARRWRVRERVSSASRGSLAVRLTAVAVATTALSLLLVLAGVVIIFDGQQRVSVDAALAVRATDLGTELDETGPAGLAGVRGAVLLERGTVLVGDPELGALALPACDVGSPRTVADGELRVLSRCRGDGQVLVVSASLLPASEARERLVVLLGSAALLLLGFVGAIVARAVRGALAPVDALTTQAARISESRDLAARMPPVPGHDELSRLASTLDAMLGRLESAFAHERAFIDDASHELRTPLAVLRGELELALDAPDDHEAVQVSLRAAHGEAVRLGVLAEDLLLSARLQAGPVPSGTPCADLDAVLARVVATTPMPVGLRMAPGTTVGLSESALERVLRNLLGNAAAAGATRTLVEAGPDGGATVLAVHDDGPGFPPEFVAHAFERFSRADVARGRTGAGLGLSLVLGLAEAAGGTASGANGGLLGGAVVTVRVPR